MCCADDADEQVVVVGERSLTCLDAHGLPLLYKRLDFTPTACSVLPVRVGSTVAFGAWSLPPCMALQAEEPLLWQGSGSTPARLLLAAPTGQLAVFAGAHLIWLAQLGQPVDALSIGSFAPTRGLVVGLGASGELSVSYLGMRLAASHPALTRVGLVPLWHPSSGLNAVNSRQINRLHIYFELSE